MVLEIKFEKELNKEIDKISDLSMLSSGNIITLYNQSVFFFDNNFIILSKNQKNILLLQN